MKAGAAVALFLLALPLSAFDEAEILRAGDLSVVDSMRFDVQVRNLGQRELEEKSAQYRRMYRFFLERSLTAEEAQAASGEPLERGRYLLITKKTATYRAVLVYWLAVEESKLFIFSEQETAAKPDSGTLREAAVAEAIETLKIAPESASVFNEAKPVIEAEFGPIEPEMLGKLTVRKFDVRRRADGELYLANVATTILDVKYREDGVRIIFDVGRIIAQLPDRVEIRDSSGTVVLRTNLKNITEETYRSVEAAANKHLGKILRWSHDYTIDGYANLDAYGEAGKEYVIMFYPQYQSYVLIYDGKAERLDPGSGGVFLIRPSLRAARF